MPTIFTHALAGAVIAQAVAPCPRRRQAALLAAGCAMLPDADVVGLRMGIAYGDLLGHRGFTHSILFAAMMAGACAWLWPGARERLRILIAVFAATVSHGVLDAFTNGGMGIAFFAPFDNTRYFFPATPIAVSPLRVSAFLSGRGLRVLGSEFLWVWCPALAVAISVRWLRCGDGGGRILRD